MSTPIAVDIPHQLGAPEAKRRIDQGFVRLAEQVGGPGLAQVKSTWDGDRMSFSLGMLGQVICGQLLVTSDMVRIEVHLPAFLGALASSIKGRLHKQGQLLLEKK